jgi:TonB family protein
MARRSVPVSAVRSLFEVTPGGARFVALATSAALHVAVAASLVGHAGSRADDVAPATTFEVLVLPPETAAQADPSTDTSPFPEAQASTPREPKAAPASTRASRHDLSLVHDSPSLLVAPTLGGPVTPAVSTPADAHFVLGVVLSVGRAATVERADTQDAEAATNAEDVASEDGVDARPVLLSGNAPPYPPAAANAGVEVNVPVTIVIGVNGDVLDARAQRHVGYGLDEAALRAVRSYRFSRGLRGGRPVRVRMTWTVMFRLQ